MFRRASMALTAILVSAVFNNAGCYSSHRRPPDSGPIDAEVRRDAGTDAGVDAGPITCCTDWRFERRLLIEGFGDEQTVTPRLTLHGGLPAVVVTGPSDAIGPSGGHLVRLSRDLSTFDIPRPVTRGSYTWAQPASSGDVLGVCWGTDTGDVARLYDAAGRPVSDIITLDTPVRSPCIDAAFSSGHFAFVYGWRGPAGSDVVRVRLLDAVTLAARAFVDTAVDPVAPSAALVGTTDGFALALAGAETQLILFDSTGAVRARTPTGPARQVRLVLGGSELQLLRARTEDLWLLETFEPSSLRRLSEERPLGRFGSSPPPTFDVATDACGTPILGTSTPSLAVALPTGLVEYLPEAPPLDPSYGDTSVLVLGTDAYVAFSASSPSLNPQVHVDHYVCNVE